MSLGFHLSKSPKRSPSCACIWFPTWVSELVMLELSRLCRRLMPSCSEPERRRWRTLTVAMYLAHGHAPEMWIEHKSLVVPSSAT